MGLLEDEVAADNQMREFDRLSTSPLFKHFRTGTEVAGALNSVTSSGILASITAASKIAELYRAWAFRPWKRTSAI
jgi:hypothetical protein